MTARDIHLRDQIRAATADAERAVLAVGARPGNWTRATENTPWVLELLADVMARRGRCRHLPVSPAVVFLPAHRRRIMCPACARRSLLATRGTREDRTCDRCRRLCTQLHPMLWAVGPVVVTAGGCAQCVPAMTGTAVTA